MRRTSHRKNPWILLAILVLGGVFFVLKNFDIPVEKVEVEIPYSKLQKQ